MKSKIIFYCIYIFFDLLIQSFNTYSQTFQWAKQIGGTDNDRTNSLTTDASGNLIVAGSFYGAADVDPGPGNYYLYSNGFDDIFVSKYDPSGNIIWGFSIGGVSNDEGVFVKTDASGNIYVAGHFRSQVDFDPSSNSFDMDSYGHTSIFIARYDASGNLLAAKKISGVATNDCFISGFVTELTGNIYVTGYLNGTVSFNNSSPTDTISGTSDAFFAKYDNSGNFIFAKKIESSTGVSIRGIDINSSSEILVCGDFIGTCDFDPDPTVFSYSSPTSFPDAWYAKYSNTGSLLWVNNISSNSVDRGDDITVNPLTGNIYVTGTFSMQVDFDPSANTVLLNAGSGGELFLASYDSNGGYLWAKNCGKGYLFITSSSAKKFLLKCDGNSLFLSGAFKDSIDLDPNIMGNAFYHSNGNFDLFVSGYSLSGNFAGAYASGGVQEDVTKSIAVNNNQVYLAGYFNSAVDFDATSTLTSFGGEDGFFLKLSDFSTGVNVPSAFENETVRIYPNPSSGNFFVNIPQDFKFKNAELIISDITGRKIKQIDADMLNAKNEHHLMNLKDGIYFYSLADDCRTVGSGKLIIQKQANSQ